MTLGRKSRPRGWRCGASFTWRWKRQELAEQVHMTEVYGRGCARLARLLKAEGFDHTRLDAVMHDLVDEVIVQVGEELGIE